MSNIPVITLDGPSGSGKGTLSVKLAQTLQWHFLDSGAIYRLLALYVQQQEVAINDEAALVQLANTLPATFTYDIAQGQTEILLAGKAVKSALRTENTGYLASSIAKLPAVRTALLARQQAFKKLPGLIADGRDMGTVVFPDAPLKFYLEASPKARAERRFLQLQAQGHDVSLDNLLTEINQRDLQDKTRQVAPLIPAEDAVIVDTTHLGIAEVYTELLNVIKAKYPHWLRG